MFVGFGCCEACCGQLEQNLFYTSWGSAVPRCWYIGRVLTGAPQIAAMIIGFSIVIQALMNGEY